MVTAAVTTLGPFDTLLTAVNTAGAAVAAVYNARAVRRVAAPRLRAIYASTAALAAMYVAAYLVLIFSPVSRAQWSQTMGGVSVVVWFVVWTANAWAEVHKPEARQFAEDVKNEVRRALEGEL